MDPKRRWIATGVSPLLEKQCSPVCDVVARGIHDRKPSVAERHDAAKVSRCECARKEHRNALLHRLRFTPDAIEVDRRRRKRGGARRPQRTTRSNGVGEYLTAFVERHTRGLELF